MKLLFDGFYLLKLKQYALLCLRLYVCFMPFK